MKKPTDVGKKGKKTASKPCFIKSLTAQITHEITQFFKETMKKALWEHARRT
ncbi:MAG: hypothetical protein ACI4MZ_02220 [Christensenellales bacterium]